MSIWAQLRGSLVRLVRVLSVDHWLVVVVAAVVAASHLARLQKGEKLLDRGLGAHEITLLVLRQLLDDLWVVLCTRNCLELLPEQSSLEALQTICLFLFSNESLDVLQIELLLRLTCELGRRSGTGRGVLLLLRSGCLRRLTSVLQRTHELLQGVGSWASVRLIHACRGRGGRRRRGQGRSRRGMLLARQSIALLGKD